MKATQRKMAYYGKSKVISLLDMVWRNTNRGGGFSWERLNHSMSDALGLTIGSGFPFKESDFKVIAQQKYPHTRWGGFEWCYRLAIESGNRTAIASFEAWTGRKPFIARNVTLCRYFQRSTFLHSGGVRKLSRVAVGCTFELCGEVFEVTSFNDAKGYLIAKKISDTGLVGPLLRLTPREVKG